MLRASSVLVFRDIFVLNKGRDVFSSVRYHVWRLRTVKVVGGHSFVNFLELLKALAE